MPIAADKIRVLIATTNGPVEVLLLTEEDAAIGRCVACIGGTTETADIASAYHAFVVRPTGIIESRFGHSCYRLDVSGRIDAGSSWQLGVLAAHALLAAGRLAQENDTADAVLWATGSVRPVDLTVGAVGHVPEKLANSLDRLKQERAAGRRMLLAVPAANAAEVPAELAGELSAEGFELIAPAHVQLLFDALAMPLPDSRGKVTAKTIDVTPGPALAVTPSTALTVAPRRRRWLVPAAVAAVLLAAVGTAAVWLKRQPESNAASSPGINSGQKSAAPPRVALVPERIPFITAQDRARVRDEYMTAPDYKALASSLLRIEFVIGQPTQEAADRAALEACEKLSGPTPSFDNVCELYASGNVVVTRRNRPPMPPEPWFVRNPAIERPFAAAQFPLSVQSSKDQLNKSYTGSARAKAVVMAPSGRWWSTVAQPTQDDAVRRSLERCGYTVGAACMVVAIDDTFVIPIPTLARVVGFYRREGLVGVKSNVADEVARRLAEAPNAWNAIAIGADGNVGIATRADSERSALDDALADCAKHDRDCRISVLGAFLVEATSQPQPPEPQVAKTLTPPAPAPASVALVPDQIPFLAAADRERVRKEYMPGSDYKALAISFTHIALVTGQSSQEMADRTAMELCEKLESADTTVCDLYASGNVVVTKRSPPPMPAQPWVVRNRAVEQPFVVTQIPIVDAANMERIANSYPRAPKSKALVMSMNGRWVLTTTQPVPDDAVRRSLERCGRTYSSPCVVVAIDDTFVIPIPTLAKAVGFFRPEGLTGVTSEVRAEVARRLAGAPNSWDAVAVGSSGNFGIVLDANSEQSAFDGALADCAKRDRDCHIAVLGPFLVQSANSEKRAATP